MSKSQDVWADPCLQPYEEENPLLKNRKQKQLCRLFFCLLFLPKDVKALLWYFIFKPKVRQVPSRAAADP